MHPHRGGGMVHGFMAAMATFWLIGGALFIGVVLDFQEHPWGYIRDYWFPALLFFIGVVGMMRERR